MSYRNDEDLEFLGSHLIKHDDLDPLFKHLIDRYTHEFHNYECYKEHQYKNNHCLYWKAIAAELQKFGGNTIANKFRGHGVKYKEIACDVAKKLNVKCSEYDDIEDIEYAILEKLLEDSFKKMSEIEKQEFIDSFNESFNNLDETTKKELLQQNVDLARLLKSQLNAKNAFNLFKFAFKKGGFKSYQLTVIIANAVAKSILGKGISLAGNAALTKGMALLAGPIGAVISGVLTIYNFSGPAYRVTIPAVPMVAMLRMEYKNRKNKSVLENIIEDDNKWLIIGTLIILSAIIYYFLN